MTDAWTTSGTSDSATQAEGTALETTTGQRLLLVDDAAALTELFAKSLSERLGTQVDACVAVVDVELHMQGPPHDLAIVDLSFPQENANGLDALAEIHRRHPSTKLAIMTQGDAWVSAILRDAWELLPITTVISKTAPLDYQIDMIRQVLTTGTAEVDPAIQSILPTRTNPARTVDRFGDLIQHQGHAKVWRALMEPGFDATYKNVSATTGLKLNTVKNYRAQLLHELRLHGLDEPSLREMQEFATRCRAFLRPYVDSSIGD